MIPHNLNISEGFRGPRPALPNDVEDGLHVRCGATLAARGIGPGPQGQTPLGGAC